MPVPKTAVDENDLSPLSENQIRVSWQIPSMKPVSVTEGKDEFADKQLRPRVLGADARHDL
jgi:hypothetical protein